MNIADFKQLGGLPFGLNTLDFMQESYLQLAVLGALAGNKSIITGCETEGDEVTDGYVYLNGELFFFKGGLKQDKVIIVETKESVVFKDVSVKGVYVKRHITFGDDGTAASIPWVEFRRYYPNRPNFKEIRWVGSDVQQADLERGWFIANGQNGTDNLLGKMLIGHDPTQTEFNQIGKTGGSKTKTLNENNIPLYDPKRGIYKHLAAKGSDIYKSTDANAGDSSGGSTELAVHGINFNTSEIQTFGKASPDSFSTLNPYFVAKPIQFIG